MHRGMSFAAVALVFAVLPGGPAFADCKADIDSIQSRLEQAKVRETFKGREADHPLVLVMADGKLVDLTGYMIVDASIQESWMGDRPVVQSVSTLLADAKTAIDEKKDDECAAIYQKITALIEEQGVGEVAKETVPTESASNATATISTDGATTSEAADAPAQMNQPKTPEMQDTGAAPAPAATTTQ